jgi:hypothetical protein
MLHFLNIFPGPCVNNGKCPKDARCVDKKADLSPEFECVCQMGMVEEGGRCISPPPTTPTPRPKPSMTPSQIDVSYTLLMVRIYIYSSLQLHSLNIKKTIKLSFSWR